jgi:AcrR family transcriptional regulator
MAQQHTEQLIRMTAKQLFARSGYDGVSMRILSKESGVGLSSIYHFFKDKDVLLRDIYAETNKKLGIERSNLPEQPTAEKMLAQLIKFQFSHSEDIVYVLKYYLHFRHEFAALPTRTLPVQSVRHVEEVIVKGNETGEFQVETNDLTSKAKVIAHTINGYLLEYYPDSPDSSELEGIVNDIVAFSRSGLTPSSTK